MDFLRVLFTAVLYLNIPMAITSFVFAFILLRRAKGNGIYFNFGMATLFLALWQVALPLLFIDFSLPFNIFLVNVTWLFGIWIMHYFLIFTYNFPISTLYSHKQLGFLYLLTLFVSFTFFIPDLYTKGAYPNFPFLKLVVNPIGLTIYTVFFVSLAFFSFKNLIVNFLKSDGIFRIQLKKIIIGTGVAVIANLFLSITIYYFIDFDTAPLGTVFVFAVLLYIYSILFSKKYV
ncbi:MAG: hypothetical protein A2744_01580 [Candidatus Buchananbacteria bacterium RIFCSPHIGHO2_01_FULL_44_11]|uniref:Histidine kinase N-terminal 7TM region domain-containing protein n=1 Tax=Candidatus Buchananbacteria bacterium RIFCSPHIGHO2_01_FULL_44_11 TaxID=1797535 RepID=A0A1G1Y0D4_9BACT|nr:MAG: hypothetical protein A2744_01580 [Candidatus Buchananbacteria bacterium RIFCSPHIGHO2_01_FULL_44_11]